MTGADAIMDTTLAHFYECARLTEAPNLALPHFYYPGASTQGGRDGVLAKVSPAEGKPWLGTFAFGQIAPKGASGIFTTPSPQRLCVVARGEGYIVSADAPTQWEPVRARPIMDVRPIRARGLIVFACFTAAAYGLEFAPQAAEPVLEALSRGPFGPTRATASITLDEWRKGRLKFP
jgi:hypothetical protein